MTGRGKAGKGLGKGGAIRRRMVLRDNLQVSRSIVAALEIWTGWFCFIQGITKPAIRRLARRGGVKRISGLIYEETRGVLKVNILFVVAVMCTCKCNWYVCRCSWRMSSATPSRTLSMPRGRLSLLWTLSMPWRGRAGLCTDLAARDLSRFNWLTHAICIGPISRTFLMKTVQKQWLYSCRS